jgi:glycolate oxidase FAD binding subunit
LVVVVGFEDSEDAVGWQVRQVIQELPPVSVHGLEARAGAASEPLWRALVEFTLRPEAQLTFKANLLPGAVAAFCLRAAEFPEGVYLHAQAGSGIVRGHVGALTLERAQVMLNDLHGAARAAQGNVTLLHCPVGWKKTLPVWGLPRGDRALMRQVKEKLDPRRLFNPGRFLDAI